MVNFTALKAGGREMGLAVVPNGSTPTKSSKTVSDVAKGGPQKKSSKSSRKGWTLFILKQNASCGSENSPVEAPKKKANYPCQGCGKEQHQQHQHQQKKASKSPPRPKGDCCTRGDGRVAAEIKPSKERLRGLAAIVQDVLSRSRSELRREYSTKKSQEDPRSTAKVVGFDTIAASKDSAPETSLSFRMRLVDRCDTDLGVVASLRNGSRKGPASVIGCEPSQSCRYPLQRPGEGASIVGMCIISLTGVRLFFARTILSRGIAHLALERERIRRSQCNVLVSTTSSFIACCPRPRPGLYE